LKLGVEVYGCPPAVLAFFLRHSDLTGCGLGCNFSGSGFWVLGFGIRISKADTQLRMGDNNPAVREDSQPEESRLVNRFRGGLVFKAHRLVYHSTLGWRVIKKKKSLKWNMEGESGPLRAVHVSRHKWPGGLVSRGSQPVRKPGASRARP